MSGAGCNCEQWLWSNSLSMPFQSTDFLSSLRNGVIMVGHTPSGSTLLFFPPPSPELIAARLLGAKGTLHAAIAIKNSKS